VLVLQGNVATKLSYGGKFFILVMSHFFLIPTVKEFQKSTNICQSYSKNKSGTVFSDSQCTLLDVYLCTVNATRVPKKVKPSKDSTDVASPQKVEGLRNRVKKSSIELAVELRAKLDAPVRQLIFIFLSLMPVRFLLKLLEDKRSH